MSGCVSPSFRLRLSKLLFLWNSRTVQRLFIQKFDHLIYYSDSFDCFTVKRSGALFIEFDRLAVL